MKQLNTLKSAVLSGLLILTASASVFAINPEVKVENRDGVGNPFVSFGNLTGSTFEVLSSDFAAEFSESLRAKIQEIDARMAKNHARLAGILSSYSTEQSTKAANQDIGATIAVKENPEIAKQMSQEFLAVYNETRDYTSAMMAAQKFLVQAQVKIEGSDIVIVDYVPTKDMYKQQRKLFAPTEAYVRGLLQKAFIEFTGKKFFESSAFSVADISNLHNAFRNLYNEKILFLPPRINSLVYDPFLSGSFPTSLLILAMNSTRSLDTFIDLLAYRATRETDHYKVFRVLDGVGQNYLSFLEEIKERIPRLEAPVKINNKDLAPELVGLVVVRKLIEDAKNGRLNPALGDVYTLMRTLYNEFAMDRIGNLSTPPTHVEATIKRQFLFYIEQIPGWEQSGKMHILDGIRDDAIQRHYNADQNVRRFIQRVGLGSERAKFQISEQLTQARQQRFEYYRNKQLSLEGNVRGGNTLPAPPLARLTNHGASCRSFYGP